MFLKRFVLFGTYFSMRCAIIKQMNREAVIQTYFHAGDGFCPLVICPGWQVSQLNDRSDLHADTIRQMERHDATDEVFILIKGDASLIVGTERADTLALKALRMKPGVTYNVPRGVWHTIMTLPGMQVMIVEKNNTHVDDVTLRTLTNVEREVLKMKLTGDRCLEV
jgi:ureidoglycolate hydrolase